MRLCIDIKDTVFGQESNRESPEYKAEVYSQPRIVIIIIIIIIMARAFSRPPPTVKDRDKHQARLFGFCGGQIGSGTGFILSTSVFPGH